MGSKGHGEHYCQVCRDQHSFRSSLEATGLVINEVKSDGSTEAFVGQCHARSTGSIHVIIGVILIHEWIQKVNHATIGGYSSEAKRTRTETKGKTEAAAKDVETSILETNKGAVAKIELRAKCENQNVLYI